MSDAQFDADLKAALLQAVLMDFAEPLAAQEEEPDWSLPYRVQRKRMLENPNQWYRNTVRPVWKKVLRQAACLLLAATLALGSLMAVSPTVRAGVLNWLREFTGIAVVYRGVDTPPLTAPDKFGVVPFENTEALPVEQSEEPPPASKQADTSAAFNSEKTAAVTSDDTGAVVRVSVGDGEEEYIDVPVQNNTEHFGSAPAWAPTWLPDGWGVKQIQSCSDNDSGCRWLYQNGSGVLAFTCSQGAQSTIIIGGLTEDKRQSVLVGGKRADYYENDGDTYLLWAAAGGFFSLESGPYASLSKEELIKIAQSMRELSLASRYTLNWTPTGSRSIARGSVPGGVWEKLADGDNWYFWFTYASEDAGKLYTQGENARAVTVNGCAGTYWAAKKARNATYGGTVTVTLEDGSTEIRHAASGGQVATLTWTNSSGVTFSIRGAFDEETLLRMAESVAAKS